MLRLQRKVREYKNILSVILLNSFFLLIFILEKANPHCSTCHKEFNIEHVPSHKPCIKCSDFDSCNYVKGHPEQKEIQKKKDQALKQKIKDDKKAEKAKKKQQELAEKELLKLAKKKVS